MPMRLWVWRSMDDDGLAQHALIGSGAILHLTGQLAAGSIDVITTRFAHRRDDAGISQDASKCLHALIRRTVQT